MSHFHHFIVVVFSFFILSFSDFASKGAAILASEVLAEVPKQVVEYMTKRGIRPNAPSGGVTGAASP